MLHKWRTEEIWASNCTDEVDHHHTGLNNTQNWWWIMEVYGTYFAPGSDSPKKPSDTHYRSYWGQVFMGQWPNQHCTGIKGR